MTAQGVTRPARGQGRPPLAWMPAACLWDDDLRQRWLAWRDERVLRTVAEWLP